MFRFKRELILTYFLKMQIDVGTLSRLSGVSSKAIKRAIEGLPVGASVIAKIATALKINALDYLDES